MRDKMEQELYEKMAQELDELRNYIKSSKNTNAVLEYAYEIIYKEDYMLIFEDDLSDFPDEYITFLYSTEKPLDWIYQAWCNSDVTHMEMLRNTLKTNIEQAINN